MRYNPGMKIISFTMAGLMLVNSVAPLKANAAGIQEEIRELDGLTDAVVAQWARLEEMEEPV